MNSPAPAPTNASASEERRPAANPSPATGRRGLAPVHDLLRAYDLKLRWSLLGNLLLGGVLAASAFGNVWTLLHPPQPEYFATTADGRLIPLIPISEPYVPQEVLLGWVSQAVAQAYTFDHVHQQEQLSRMRELFTVPGFNSHRKALEDSGLWTAVNERRLVTQVVATAPPIVTNQGVLARRYVWRLEAPIKISYQGASSTSAPQENLAEVLVVRVPTHEAPRGYAIHQLVTRPGRSR
jgi:intracellular multiplication protein IcmL